MCAERYRLVVPDDFVFPCAASTAWEWVLWVAEIEETETSRRLGNIEKFCDFKMERFFPGRPKTGKSVSPGDEMHVLDRDSDRRDLFVEDDIFCGSWFADDRDDNGCSGHFGEDFLAPRIVFRE